MTSLKILLSLKEYFLRDKPLLATRNITLDFDLRESIYRESRLDVHASSTSVTHFDSRNDGTSRS